MKLSPRLAHIDQLISRHYQHIWDCCCDHGQLGARLLERAAAETVHFVDQVATICSQLERQLSRYFPNNKPPLNHRWQVHCIDAGQLPLTADHSDKLEQLIIIAGVGGELSIRLIDEILRRNPHRPLEFILCPVHHQYELRKHLSSKPLGLISEHLVEDNQRYYEILHLSTQANRVISPIGQQMWQLHQPAHQQYLQRNIQHYQRLSQTQPHPALSHYQALLAQTQDP